MIDFESMIKNENSQDVILYFSGRTENGVSHPQLDRYFTTYSGGRVSNIDLIMLVRKMQSEDAISYNGKGGYKKGPNWRIPKFVTEKKYGIE